MCGRMVLSILKQLIGGLHISSKECCPNLPHCDGIGISIGNFNGRDNFV